METNEVVLVNSERLPLSRSQRQTALLAVAQQTLEG